MRQLLEKGKYFVLLAVVATLLASIATFIWATIRMLSNIYHMFYGLAWIEESEATAHHTVAVLDSFILAVILYIFAIALYELFIGELKLPEWLIIRDLDDLKKKLSSVIALMLAVTFLKHLARWEDPQGTLMFAIAIGIVIFALVFYMKTKEKG
ncbi:MAG: YqhA family protein [Deltaproteobacteria bacterium]|nr:YqhA family protein [Deltaproteobacteria bacterium]